MNICVIGSVFARSNDDAEVPWLRHTLRMLKDRGHDVTVYVPAFKGRGSHTIDGIPVVRFRYFFAPWESLTHDEGAPNKIHRWYYKAITLFYLIAGTWGLIRLHRKKRFDVLHVHWPAPHALFGYAARCFAPARVVLNFHGASLLMCRRFAFLRHFLRPAIARADAVIVNSSFTGAQVRDIHARAVTVIPYGTTIVPKEDIDVAARSPHAVLAVGRLIERKGFAYLIEAMARVRAQHADARCTIVGGGPLYDALHRTIARQRLEDTVTLAGRVSNERLEQLYRSHGMFVLPAIEDAHGDTEGLGVVLIEALTYRLPVIGTSVGGIPDIVLHEDTGLLVPQKDPGALAAAIIRLCSEPTVADTLATRGYAHVRDHFSWDAIIDRLEDVLGVLGSHHEKTV
jgi:glycosyltransferase involved in cell wall biosynthesis